jgi:hypothetical protein
MFDADDVVVACAKSLRPDDVRNYRHLSVALNDGVLTFPPTQLPPPHAGRYSQANVEGREIVRRDLPMIEKTFYWETPNWGDWSNGSHTMWHTREVYQRDLIPPKEVELTITLLREEANPVQFVVKFAVDQVLNRRSEDFEQELLYNLNILQENVEAIDVFPSDATLADFTASVRVDWEILPPGTVDEIVRRMLRGKGQISEEKRGRMRERLTVLSRLDPRAYIAGTSGFLRYFGAQFADDLVVFENLNHGNALYIMYEDWAALSQRNRIDLLKGPREGFDRIVHRDGWEVQLEGVVKAHLGD